MKNTNLLIKVTRINNDNNNYYYYFRTKHMWQHIQTVLPKIGFNFTSGGMHQLKFPCYIFKRRKNQIEPTGQ